jgi:hypothetical protein
MRSNHVGKRAVVVAMSLCSCLAFVRIASADIIAYDGFNYAAGIDLVGNSGGTGFSGAWAAGGFNASSSANYDVASGSLAFSTLLTSGNRVSTGSTQVIAGVTRTLAAPLGADGTTTYLSMLLRPEGTLTAGGFFGLTLETAGEPELFFGRPGNGVNQYVVEDRGGAGQVSSGVDAVLGESVLLVLEAQFLAGNDVFTLYVNPTPGGPEPLSGAVKSNSNVGPVNGLTIYSAGAFSIDELRVGDTFADVTPSSTAVPLPGTALAGLTLLSGFVAARPRRSGHA